MMRGRKFLLCLLLLAGTLVCCGLYANSVTDSLWMNLRRMKQDTNRVKVMDELIQQLVTIGIYPQADSLIQEQLDLSQRLNYKPGIANAYNNLGVVCNYQSDYSHSLDYLLKSLKLYEELNSKRGQAIALKYLGTVYAQEGDSVDAVNYLHKALRIFVEIKDTDYIATALLSVGNLYESQGDHANALAHLSKALELFKSVHEQDGIASALMYMGNVYNNRNDFPEALDYYAKALQIFQALGDKAGIAGTFASEGKIYRKQGNMADAMEYDNKAIAIAHEIGALDVIKDAELELSSIYEEKGNGSEALRHYKAYVAEHDTIFNQQSTQRAMREEMNLEFAKKEAVEKANDEKREALHRAEVKKKEETIYYISGILVLVLGFAGFAYRSYMQSKKAHYIIGEKNRQITESINYAERIQHAMLPSAEEMKKAFPQSFVLFMPKDIVSGDFYFCSGQQERTYLAVADCTGHGVPGAFMSMVCSEKLNDVVKTTQNTGDILKRVNIGLKSSLHQSGDEGTQDGMDIALCYITPSVNGVKISYSGANRPLWVIPKGQKEIHELVPTKKSVGTFTSSDEDYSTYIVQLHHGDTFYMFTDGYTDQFGGNEGKKISVAKFKELLLSIQDKPMPEQEKELLYFLQDWKKDMAQQDDILVMGVRI